MKQAVSKRTSRRRTIKIRIRKRMQGTAERPRLAVYRSLRQIYAQLVDDSTSRTLVTVSSLSETLRAGAEKGKGKIPVAKLVGKAIGEEAKKRHIEHVVFDRSGYLYHGRVKAVADGAREAGLKF